MALLNFAARSNASRIVCSQFEQPAPGHSRDPERDPRPLAMEGRHPRAAPSLPVLATSEPVPVSVLKPLKGCDTESEACLESWINQDYPGPIQILFGLSTPDDPAAPLVRRLIARYPGRDLALAVASATLGTNEKVSKLIHLERLARHDLLVVSDADVRAPAGLLRQSWLPSAPETGARSFVAATGSLTPPPPPCNGKPSRSTAISGVRCSRLRPSHRSISPSARPWRCTAKPSAPPAGSRLWWINWRMIISSAVASYSRAAKSGSRRRWSNVGNRPGVGERCGVISCAGRARFASAVRYPIS